VGKWMNLMGSDLQLKIISQDLSIEKSQPCEHGDAVYIDFTGRRATDRDDTKGSIFQEANNWLIVIGDKDVTPALELAVRFMEEGETGLVFSMSKFAYGATERVGGIKYTTTLPAHSDICYEVKVKKLIKSQVFSPEFQIEIALSKKIIANDCYQFEWSNGNGKQKAITMYRKAADVMINLLAEEENNAQQQQNDNTKDYQKKANEVAIDCINNISAVYLKSKEYKKAKDAATEVILRDSNNFKALLRAARAALYDPTGTFEESEAALAAAKNVCLDIDNKDLRKMKLELENKKKQYKKKRKELFSKMSSGFKVKKEIKDEKAAQEKEISSNEKNMSAGASTVVWWRNYAKILLQVLLPILICYCLVRPNQILKFLK